MPTNVVNKIEKLEDKIKQLEAQKKELQAKVRDKERKERTRNLIQIGAILQSIDAQVFSLPADAELFKQFVVNTDQGKAFLAAYKEYHQEQLRLEVEAANDKSQISIVPQPWD